MKKDDIHMIERRKYGLAGETLPVIGIGCWAFGGGDYWGHQDQKDVDAVVGLALERGVNYFDTAEEYNDGRSETALGLALKGRRQNAIIGTKVPPNFTEPAILRQHCEDSLRRLGTDVIDIYMVHWPITDQSVADAFATLEVLQSEGKIRTIGVSNFGPQQLQEALVTGARITINQLCYNLLSRAIEAELMPLCSRLGIGILAYMPLLQGLLTGKYHSADEMPSVRTRTRHFRGDRIGSRHGEAGAEAETFAAIQGIREIASELQVPMEQVAIAWIFSRHAITSAIAGIRSVDQLEEAIASAEFRLPANMVARLDELTEPLLTRLGPSPDYFQPSLGGRTC
jgi:aryl-alcohol dehydrogenase-like predicted oxidoreductase